MFNVEKHQLFIQNFYYLLCISFIRLFVKIIISLFLTVYCSFHKLYVSVLTNTKLGMLTQKKASVKKIFLDISSLLVNKKILINCLSS